MFEPLVNQKKSLVIDAIMVQVVDQKLSDHKIKSGLGVKIEDKDWLLGGVKGMLDGLGKQESCQFMTTSFTLELCPCLVCFPIMTIDVTDVGIKCLAQKGTGGDGSET